MAKLIYSAITSLDGYVEAANGKFDWAVPDEEVHAFVNAFERPVGTYLYGRRMYETMASWEAVSIAGDLPAVIRDFAALWQAAEKFVYSTTLQTVASARTRIERVFDPAVVRRLKEAARSDITVGGPELAGHALAAAQVDECRLFVNPIVVGGGKRALPRHLHAKLEWWTNTDSPAASFTCATASTADRRLRIASRAAAGAHASSRLEARRFAVMTARLRVAVRDQSPRERRHTPHGART